MKKNLLISILFFTLISCEKSELRADNEFYNQSLDTQINGYEIWAKEAEEFADKNEWAQEVDVFFGILELNYVKRQKSNTEIGVKINYVLNIKDALDSVKHYSGLIGYDLSKSVIRTGFYFRKFNGGNIYQIWTIPYKSLSDLNDKGIKIINIDYGLFETGRTLFRLETGNLEFIDLNNITNSEKLTPETEIGIISVFGDLESEKAVYLKNIRFRKIKDFNKP